MSRVKFQEITQNQEIKEYFFPSLWSEIKEYFFYLIKVLLIVGLLYILIRSSVMDKIAVTGISMQPNYNTIINPTQDNLNTSNIKFQNQDKVILDKFTPKFSTYKRGEVVVVISPDQEGSKAEKSLFFKRVIGLPGESIRFENGKVYIINSNTNSNGFQLNESEYLSSEVMTFKNVFDQNDNSSNIVKIPDNFYFVMGDNRSKSNDSRIFGPISKDQIRGRELYRLDPPNHSGWSKVPTYKTPK